MRVLVLWARPNGNGNLGVRVLAEGAAALIRTALGSETEVDFMDFGSRVGGTGLTRKAMLVDGLLPGKGPLTQLLAGYDMVVDTGAGDSFTDHYGMSRHIQMSYVKRATRRSGTPLVLAPQTIGPFNSRLGRSLGRAGLRASSLVIARDSISADAAGSLGRPVDVKATDLVFALPEPTPAEAPHDVVLNVSGLLWHENSHVDSAAYRALVHRLIAGLTERDAGVTLLAHVVGPREGGSRDNDVPPVVALAKQYSAAGVRVLVPSSLDEVRSELASAALLIGSRMHACLNAISVGTPAIPLAYSRKFAPLLADLGWDVSFDLRDGTDHATRVFEIMDDSIRMDRLREQVGEVRRVAAPQLASAARALAEVAHRG